MMGEWASGGRPEGRSGRWAPSAAVGGEWARGVPFGRSEGRFTPLLLPGLGGARAMEGEGERGSTMGGPSTTHVDCITRGDSLE